MWFLFVVYVLSILIGVYLLMRLFQLDSLEAFLYTLSIFLVVIPALIFNIGHIIDNFSLAMSYVLLTVFVIEAIIGAILWKKQTIKN